MALRFARVGGLSAVKYKPNSTFGANTYHSPPVKKGIYAFMWPYLEMFLVAWSDENVKEWKKNGFRIFDFQGELYTHLKPDHYAGEESNWYRVTSEDLEIILKKQRHAIKKEYRKNSAHVGTPLEMQSVPHDPLKGFYSKDDFEVFIPSDQLGRIR